MEQLDHLVGRFQKLSSRLIYTVFFTVAGFILIIILYSYFHHINTAEKQKLKELKGISCTVSTQIDGKAHQQLTKRYPSKNAITSSGQDSLYRQIHNTLKEVQEINELSSPIYTLFFDPDHGKDSTLYFGVSSEEPFYRHVYENPPDRLIAKFDTGSTIDKYTTESGTWLSAFGPIRDRNGNVVGVVQVDKRFDEFLMKARRELATQLLIFLAFMVPFGIGVFRFSRKVVKDMGQVNDRLEQMVEQRTEDLAEGNRQLNQLNEELEAKVEERTQQLQQTNRRLEESNNELKDFAYVVSHDLQEPLRMISTYSTMLEKKMADKLESDTRQFLHFIQDGSQRVQQLIRDLLTYSRLDYKHREVEEVALDKVLTDVKQNLSLQIEEANAKIECCELPKIHGNTHQMLQLFQNLIGNALKHSNGKVPEIDIDVQDQGDKWQIALTDNGPGIDEKDCERIFQIFQRANSKTDQNGTGVGLAICKKIVNKHGGRIWVDSEPGKGTTFYFTLKKDEK